MDIIEKFLNNNIAEKRIIKLIIFKYLSNKCADIIINSDLTVQYKNKIDNIWIIGATYNITIIYYNGLYRNYRYYPNSDLIARCIDVTIYENLNENIFHSPIICLDYYMTYSNQSYDHWDDKLRYVHFDKFNKYYKSYN